MISPLPENMQCCGFTLHLVVCFIFFVDLFVIVVYSPMQLHNVTLALDLLIDRGLPVQSVDPLGNYFGTIQTLAVSIDC